MDVAFFRTELDDGRIVTGLLLGCYWVFTGFLRGFYRVVPSSGRVQPVFFGFCICWNFFLERICATRRQRVRVGPNSVGPRSESGRERGESR